MSKFNNDGYVCPVFASSGKCGEQEDALTVMEQFKDFYEGKLSEIDVQGGGDCLELKLKVQRRWIDDLTEQTQMMARIVKELEDEATSRVRMLEDKLRQTSKSAYEVTKRYQTYSISHNLDDPFQKAYYLESDLKNVLEFLRRVRDDHKWSIEGLQFYDVTFNDLFGEERSCDCDDKGYIINGLNSNNKGKLTEAEKEEKMENNDADADFSTQLKKKTEEYDELRRSMMDMRSALTEEVACKHDMISTLKKDIQQLEERCLQADKQTAFKDDIIKELRKEIRHLKQLIKEKEVDLTQQLEDAKNKLKRMKPCVELKSACTEMDEQLVIKKSKLIQNKDDIIQIQCDTLNVIELELQASRKREKDLEDEISRRQGEVEELKQKCIELEKTLASAQGRGENLQKAESKCATRGELKKLRQQNHYYVHVVDCFKNEMSVMSEQLMHLQEILNLSNQSCREESGQLYTAVVELQNLSKKLQSQLIDTEKKALMENQKNQLKDAKIDELQLIIGQKNADLNVHDEAINEMKMRLENALIENHELQSTIVSLNSTVMQLQCCLKNGDVEKSTKRCKSRSVTCKRSHSDCRDDYDRKCKRMVYEDQLHSSKSIQQELERIKEKNKDKIKRLKRQNEDLKEKLATSELSNKHLMEQLTQLKEQTTCLSQKECSREHELAQSKQIILELRQTLIELNESLAESELHNMALLEEFHKVRSREQDDIYLSTRCEIALYKKLADNFKDALINAKTKLVEAETCNRTMNEDLKGKEVKINDLQRKAAKKDKENCQCIEELNKKLRESQAEEKRLSNFIDDLKAEVHRKLEEKRETQKVVINCCECNDMTATQEEIDSLKIEIKNMIQNQLALNNENDKLLNQVTCLQANIATLEDKNRHLKQKFERLQTENQSFREKNRVLLREKETFNQTVRSLEVELADTKNNRDDVCAESRHVVNNVKAWLEEQRKINKKVKKKAKDYCDTIAQLKQENETLLMVQPLASSTFKQKYDRRFRPCTPEDCPNVWCLGSQGTGSVLDSPRGSPASCTCSVEEWYAPNYRVRITPNMCITIVCIETSDTYLPFSFYLDIFHHLLTLFRIYNTWVFRNDFHLVACYNFPC